MRERNVTHLRSWEPPNRLRSQTSSQSATAAALVAAVGGPDAGAAAPPPLPACASAWAWVRGRRARSAPHTLCRRGWVDDAVCAAEAARTQRACAELGFATDETSGSGQWEREF